MRRRSTLTGREVVITRVVEAPRRSIFQAWTDPEHVPNWLLGPGGWTMPICEIDLRPGGAYPFGWRRPGRPDMEIHGVYREVAPPDRVVFTEWWGGDWPETVNTLSLAEENNMTTVTLTILYPSQQARDAALNTGVKDGATQSFDSLDQYVRQMA